MGDTQFQLLQRQAAVRKRGADIVMVTGDSGHYQIVSGTHTAGSGAVRAVVGGGPVGHEHALEAPLVAGSFGAQVIVVGRMDAVYQIVACHDGHRLAFFDSDLEAFQVDLAQGTLGDDGVGTHTVVFLVIAGIMLDGSAAAVYGLYAVGHGSSHLTGEQRILGVVFKVASAERIAVDVHARCKPQGYVEFIHFFRYGFADFVHHFFVPGLGKQRADGESGTELIIVFCALDIGISGKETVLDAHLERNGFDLAVYHRITLEQTQAGRSVRQNDGSQVFICQSAAACLGSRAGNRDTCGAESAFLLLVAGILTPAGITGS